jgi:hypothetical protein
MTTQKPRRAYMGAWTLTLAAALLCACGSAPVPQSPEGISLNQAIRQAAAHVESQLPPETKLALLNFNSPTEAFSRYALDELAAVFVANGRLLIVDRTDIDLIRAETAFQLSGEVNDESAQSIGKMLGAQSILSGSLTELGGVYRFMVKVLNVETARVQALFPLDLLPDSRAEALLGTAAPAQTAPLQTTAPRTMAPETTPPQTTQQQNAPQPQSAQQPAAAPPSVAAPPNSIAPAEPVENYPPELDLRMAELSALPSATDAAALIEQRNAWAALLQYVETHYREHPEFAIVYEPSIVQGNINYNRGTVLAKVAVQLTPLSGYQKAVTAVKAALDKTGRSAEWGWENWPGSISFVGSGNMGTTYFINYENIFNPQMIGPTTGGTRANFIDENIGRRYRNNNNIGNHDLYSFGKIVTVRAALLNQNNEVIAQGEQRLRFAVAYRETWAIGLGSRAPRPTHIITFSPMAIPEWFVFSDIKASDLSGGAVFKIISIDNVVLDSKSGDYIRISTETINEG